MLAGVILPLGTIIYWALPPVGVGSAEMENNSGMVSAVAGEFDWDLGRIVPATPADRSAEQGDSTLSAFSGVAANVWPAAWASIRVALPAAIFAALLAAIFAALLALPIAYYRVRHPSPGALLAERTVYLGLNPAKSFCFGAICTVTHGVSTCA